MTQSSSTYLGIVAWRGEGYSAYNFLFVNFKWASHVWKSEVKLASHFQNKASGWSEIIKQFQNSGPQQFDVCAWNELEMDLTPFAPTSASVPYHP